MSPAIYLDNAATTRVAPEVAEVIVACLREDFGNPSSAHRVGLAAANRVKAARATLLAALGDERHGEIIWTSGGTEADALGVAGAARARAGRGRHLVLTAIEHPAVLGVAKQLEREGFTTTLVPVGKDGVVDPDAVARAVGEHTVLVACMLVQNELGTIQPVADLARAARARRAEIHVHCDAVQALGKIPIDVVALGADSVAFSAHKLAGPKGSGALWLRKGARLTPLWSGGGQQNGLRSGTENVPGIAGLAEAARLAVAKLSQFKQLQVLRDRLASRVLAAGLGAWENGAGAPRAPHITSLSIPRVPAEPLLHAVEARGIYVSAGAACASKGSHGASHVLAALGLPEQAGTLRASLALDTTADEIDAVAAALVEEARRLS